MEENGIDDSNVGFVTDSFFISILSSRAVPASNFHLPVFKGNHQNVLTLTFDDVIGDNNQAVYLTGDPDKPTMIQTGRAITEDQAEELVNFIEKHKHKKVAFVHCAAGISRSGAVGAFISDLAGNKYEDFKRANPQIHENRHVKNLMNRIVYERGTD
jgi:predicted protein tyrosine phosphatase